MNGSTTTAAEMSETLVNGGYCPANGKVVLTEQEDRFPSAGAGDTINYSDIIDGFNAIFAPTPRTTLLIE